MARDEEQILLIVIGLIPGAVLGFYGWMVIACLEGREDAELFTCQGAPGTCHSLDSLVARHYRYGPGYMDNLRWANDTFTNLHTPS